MRLSLLAATVALLCLGASLVSGQEVRVEGEAGDRATRILREVLQRGDYLLLTRDTVLPGDFRAVGDLIVADADVRLEGEVDGAVAVISGSFFVRPGARVGGDLAAIGGGIYPSGLAEIGQVFEVPLDYSVDVTAEEGSFRVQVSPPAPEYLVLPGLLYGFRLPAYNRVDGLSLSWGPRWQVAGRDDGPSLSPWLSYHSARGDFGGGAAASIPLGSGVEVTARAADETRTNDDWIRGDFSNTLAALASANDIRNYFRSERVELSVALPNEIPLIEGEFAFSPRVTFLASRDRSLSARDPWSLFGEANDWRANPPVEPGTLVSLLAGAQLRWQGVSTTFSGGASLERALPGAGDFGFTQWSMAGGWEMDALWRHQITIFARGMGTLGDEGAPPQRWSLVGGSGTLPTLGDAEFRGDNLVFIESIYGIPIPALTLPLLGSPTLEIMHAVGMAWVTGAGAPPWEQNLAIGFRTSFFDARVYVDPAADLDPRFSVGLSVPF